MGCVCSAASPVSVDWQGAQHGRVAPVKGDFLNLAYSHIPLSVLRSHCICGSAGLLVCTEL